MAGMNVCALVRSLAAVKFIPGVRACYVFVSQLSCSFCAWRLRDAWGCSGVHFGGTRELWQWIGGLKIEKEGHCQRSGCSASGRRIRRRRCGSIVSHHVRPSAVVGATTKPVHHETQPGRQPQQGARSSAPMAKTHQTQVLGEQRPNFFWGDFSMVLQCCTSRYFLVD